MSLGARCLVWVVFGVAIACGVNWYTHHDFDALPTTIQHLMVQAHIDHPSERVVLTAAASFWIALTLTLFWCDLVRLLNGDDDYKPTPDRPLGTRRRN